MSSMEFIKNRKAFFIVADLVCVLAAYIGAFYIRYYGFPQRNWDSFLALLPWILLIALFFIAIYELYNLNQKHSIWDILLKTIVAVLFMSFLTMAASYLFREFAMPRSVVVIAVFFMIFLMVAWKGLYLKISRRNMIDRILLVGDEAYKNKMLSKINNPLHKNTVVKYVQPDAPIKTIDAYLRQVHYVLLSPDMSKETKAQIIYHAMESKTVVYVVPTLYELLMQRSAVSPIEDTLAVSVKPFGLSWDEKFIKRMLDIVASILLLVVSSPILFLVAILIKLEDRQGSIIYKQERLGRNQKPFTIYKFRSMIEGAEQETGPTLATENDERITKVGRFIRTVRLDEFPQLWNVLKGDMSLVGPRPEREFFSKQLARDYYHYTYRYTVKPGISGYAQIMGKYSTDVEDKLRFDLYYIRNYSFWLDIVIMLKTFVVLFDRNKSEGVVEETSSRQTAVTGESSSTASPNTASSSTIASSKKAAQTASDRTGAYGPHTKRVLRAKEEIAADVSTYQSKQSHK